MPSVVDKASGTVVKSTSEPSLAGPMPATPSAHWGGDYWVFLIRKGRGVTTVYQVDGTNGTIKSTTPTTGA